MTFTFNEYQNRIKVSVDKMRLGGGGGGGWGGARNCEFLALLFGMPVTL